tara:strand:+ start:74 stop:502 length:429 start_codon:yes stop_codon:yes gene_type:complete
MFRQFLIAALFIQSGCIANVAGSWDGDVDCGENGSVDIFAEIDSRDSYFQGTYEGTAVVEGLQMNDVDTEIDMELKLSQSDARGPQVLRVQADCLLVQEDSSTTQIDCDGFDELGWDGSDTLSGSVTNFLELFDCEIELDRN